MENIIKDIRQNCKDKSVEGIVKFLQDNGDFPFTSEYYREIWHFYSEALDMLKSKKDANELTRTFMKINHKKLRRIKDRYENRT